MYVAIDIGGTKTLVVIHDAKGKRIGEIKFLTSQDYEKFLSDLTENVAKLSTNNILHVVAAVPGLIDRTTGVVRVFGNLPWRDTPIRDDLARIFDTKVTIENDSRLAGLGAALPLKDRYRNIFFVTVSTGIGGALISEGKIVTPVQDMEIGKMPIEYEGSVQKWEEFASGRAIVATYGKLASEINDPKIWREIGLKIGYGLAVVISAFQPDVIVFGGGAGKYADKFIPAVREYMTVNLHAIVKHPDLLTAQNPEEVVIYGCYEFAKQHTQ